MPNPDELPPPSAALIFAGVLFMARLSGLKRRRRKRWAKSMDRAFERMERISRTRPLRDKEGHAEAVVKMRQAWAWWRAMRPVIARLPRRL